MQESPEIDQAVRSVGTNALPTLLRELRAQDSPPWVAFITFVEKHRIAQVHYTPSESRNMHAVLGFRALGGLAEPAVPELIKLYRTNPMRGPWGPGAALSLIGPKAKSTVPALLSNLQSTNVAAREVAAAALGEIHSDPESVIPVLITAMNDPASAVRHAAITALGRYGPAASEAVPHLVERLKFSPAAFPDFHIVNVLGEIHSQPDLVVPILTDLLCRPDKRFLPIVLGALEQFGTKAEPTFSKLAQLYRDEDDAEKAEPIARALKSINPKAARELGLN